MKPSEQTIELHENPSGPSTVVGKSVECNPEKKPLKRICKALPLPFTIAVFYFTAISTLSAVPVVELRSNTGHCPLQASVQYLEDPDGQWDLETVRSADFDSKWKNGSGHTLNFGYSNSAYWIRFQVRHTQASSDKWIVELGYTLLDRIDFYASLPEPLDANLWKHTSTGDTFPFAQREYASTDFHFALPDQTGGLQSVYIRVQSESSLVLPLTSWSGDALREREEDYRLALGLFYGIVLVMMLYNLFLFITIQERVYLYYILYLLFYVGMQAGIDGLTFKYLWPDWPWWHNHSAHFFVSMSPLFLIQFSRYFFTDPTIYSRIGPRSAGPCDCFAHSGGRFFNLRTPCRKQHQYSVGSRYFYNTTDRRSLFSAFG